MQLYGTAIQNLEASFDQVKDGVEKIDDGYNHLRGLDWDEIFEKLDDNEKREIMELINQGLDLIGDGLYEIKE